LICRQLDESQPQAGWQASGLAARAALKSAPLMPIHSALELERD